MATELIKKAGVKLNREMRQKVKAVMEGKTSGWEAGWNATEYQFPKMENANES